MKHYPNTFEQWFKENLGESARDIAEHGADCGFTYITYTSDCVELFDNYQDELWELVVNTAEESRLNLMELIATFNRVDMASTFDGLKNLIVWFACEFYAYQLTDY